MSLSVVLSLWYPARWPFFGTLYLPLSLSFDRSFSLTLTVPPPTKVCGCRNFRKRPIYPFDYLSACQCATMRTTRRGRNIYPPPYPFDYLSAYQYDPIRTTRSGKIHPSSPPPSHTSPLIFARVRVTVVSLAHSYAMMALIRGALSPPPSDR